MRKTKLPATERVVSYVAPSTGHWVIPFKDGRKKALSHTLLPPMRQEEAARYYSEGGYHAMTVPEHFELIGGLYELRGKGEDVESARQFIRTSLRKHFPLTLTRLLYQSQRNDGIVHGYGTDSPIEKQADLVGPDGNILEVLTQENSLALTGKNPEELAELMQYLNGTSTYIWRLNKRPQSVDERVAGFDAYSGWALLGCFGFPRGSGASLGVKTL